MKDYLCKKLFNRLSGTLVIRARCGNNITGLACCNILYPSPRYSGQLHIKELYVSQCDRNKGTGKAIMRFGNDSNLLIVFYVQIMPDDFVMQLHRF